MRQKKYKYNIFVYKPAYRDMRERKKVYLNRRLYFKEKAPSSKKLNEYILKKRKKRESNDSLSYSLTNPMHKVDLS